MELLVRRAGGHVFNNFFKKVLAHFYTGFLLFGIPLIQNVSNFQTTKIPICFTLLGTNISHPKALWKHFWVDDFPFSYLVGYVGNYLGCILCGKSSQISSWICYIDWDFLNKTCWWWAGVCIYWWAPHKKNGIQKDLEFSFWPFCKDKKTPACFGYTRDSTTELSGDKKSATIRIPKVRGFVSWLTWIEKIDKLTLYLRWISELEWRFVQMQRSPPTMLVCVEFPIHPGKFRAGTLKMEVWKMMFLFDWMIFRFPPFIFRGVPRVPL